MARRGTAPSLAGKPALINVWASWCSPCVTEHPLLLDTARQHAGALQVVGVLYQDTADGAAAFLAQYGDGGWPMSMMHPAGSPSRWA